MKSVGVGSRCSGCSRHVMQYRVLAEYTPYGVFYSNSQAFCWVFGSIPVRLQTEWHVRRILLVSAWQGYVKERQQAYKMSN